MKAVQTKSGVVKCRLYDLWGRRATLTRAAKNHYAMLAAGTEVTVTRAGNRGTVGVESDCCACCKVRVYITGLDPERDLVFDEVAHQPRRNERCGERCGRG